MTRNIYIVVSQTGTMLSRIIRLVTGAAYNHASISLVPDLGVMYSFGRLNPYNPFWGGFVTESPHWGTFKRFFQTEVAVLEVPVTQEQFEQLQSRIDAMLRQRQRYHYNYLGLVLAGVRIRYHQRDCYYCSEFVKEMLLCSRIPGAEDLDPIIHPIHFLSLPQARLVYRGKLTEYARVPAVTGCG